MSLWRKTWFGRKSSEQNCALPLYKRNAHRDITRPLARYRERDSGGYYCRGAHHARHLTGSSNECGYFQTSVTYPPTRRVSDTFRMAKKRVLEMYITYHKANRLHPKLSAERYARLEIADLKRLVKMAGLYIHRPDFGTGVVVINQEKTRWYPTPAETKAIRAKSKADIRKVRQERRAKVK